jgi:hypothetical protein
MKHEEVALSLREVATWAEPFPSKMNLVHEEEEKSDEDEEAELKAKKKLLKYFDEGAHFGKS